MSSLCNCGKIREKRTAGPSASFPGRQYYNCQSCGTFDWADSQVKLFDTNAGPECKCGKASVQRTVTKPNSPNKGRKFWCCAKGRDNGSCKFFEFRDNDELKDVVRTLDFSSGSKRPSLPGFATYLSDWKKVDIVQRMMAVDPKFMASYTGSSYDDIDVVGLWKIGNGVQQEKYDAAKERVKKESPNKDSDYDIPKSYQDQMNQLGNKTLDGEAGEVFLLHGTCPENLHGILFEGHDTALSNNGNFGRGIYFAENAAKIDQYSAKDERYQKGEGNVVAQLHEKIYTKCIHPKNVRYALVCRVLLGHHVTTSNGKKRLEDGEDAFTTKDRRALAALQDETMDAFAKKKDPCASSNSGSNVNNNGGSSKKRRKKLVEQTTVDEDGYMCTETVPVWEDVEDEVEEVHQSVKPSAAKSGAGAKTTTPSSLIGIPGELVSNFREFVVFNSDQVCVEYLVAYKRVRSNCDCGQKCIERTVVKQTENRGRKINLCAKGACSFMQMLPLCDCGGSATVKTSHSARNPGKEFYSCYKKRGWGRCDFFEWKQSGKYTNAGQNKRAKVSP